jgi:NAD(P)H-dependent FMN reductase
MPARKVIILVASVREGRKSNRVGLFFRNFLSHEKDFQPEILDLKEYDFPVFHERLKFTKSPGEKVLMFAEKIKSADGVVIVTPEYNGGYPAALKNVTDLLYDEWKRKPVAIVTVSSGPFGGAQVMTSLTFTLWKIGVWLVPAMFPVPKVEDAFDENGVPSDKEGTEKRAHAFVKELAFCIDAQKAMSQNT